MMGAGGWTAPAQRPILRGVREMPGAADAEWVQRMRALARQDAEEMIPRPSFPVFGVSAPPLEPTALLSYDQVNGSWAAATLAYGAWDAAAGPFVAVRSERTEPELAGASGTEAELSRAIDAERGRLAASTGVDEDEPAGAPLYSREELPAGAALVARHGTVWAARLDRPADPAAGVTVTITGRGVAPGSVRLSLVGDLRAAFEARNEILGRLTERRRREPPPVLEPAEGVAAFRALAEYELEGYARIRARAPTRPGGRLRRDPANWGRVRSALWRRAVSEQQRLSGTSKWAADDVVTSVMNHLGHLAEQAPWFTADPRLRAAALDETLRHAVLGEVVPSLPAQRAWQRYWSNHLGRALRADPRTPDDAFAEMESRRSLTDRWLAAWTAWTARA